MAFRKRLLFAAIWFATIWFATIMVLPGIGTAQTTLADVFDDSVLHEVRITMPAANWQTLKDHYLDNTYYNVDSFQWTGAPGKTLTVNNLTVRSRGHGSRSPKKPGLHVDFNRNVPTQTFFNLSEIDLKSNTQDPSLIHERISMELFTRMGVPASREVSTRVFVNGEYIGLYNLVESPDPQMLKRLFNENNGYLYEYKPGDWTGVAGAGYHFEYLGPNLDLYSSGTVSTPFDPQTPHQNAPDTVTLEAWIRTMNQASDADFLTALAPFLDPKPFLTQVAVETYLADFDCILGDVFGLNNFFLYRFQNKQLNMFIAWDKDNAFDYTQRPVLQNANQNVLMRRLLASPDLKNYYFEAVVKTTLLSGGAGGWMQQEATRMYNQIRQAALDDPNKTYLDAGNLVPASNDKFEAAVALVQSFPADRTAFVLKDLVTQGYRLPASYPTLADGGFVSVGTHALPVAAGGAAEIYGINFGTADITSLYINGYPAPLLFTSGGQVDVQVPWEAGGTATLGAIVNGSPSNVLITAVNAYAPAILAVTHTDGQSYVTPANPAAANETLVVYATGLGPVTGGMVTGQKSTATPLQSTTQTPKVTIGSASGTVSFSGLTPGFIGLYQVNVVVPANVPANSSLAIAIGGVTAQAVALPVK
jgi:uncharacterized protein (TIGR03437 family)